MANLVQTTDGQASRPVTPAKWRPTVPGTCRPHEQWTNPSATSDGGAIRPVRVLPVAELDDPPHPVPAQSHVHGKERGGDARGHRGDRQRGHRGRRAAPLLAPAGQLLGRRGIDDAAQTDPRVRGRAHRAVLAGGVHGGPDPAHGRDVVDGPRGDRELGMTGGVPVLHPVAVLEQGGAVGVDQDGPERLVTVLQRLPGQFDATLEVGDVAVGQGHRFGVYAPDPTARSDDRPSAGSTPARPEPR